MNPFPGYPALSPLFSETTEILQQVCRGVTATTDSRVFVCVSGHPVVLRFIKWGIVGLLLLGSGCQSQSSPSPPRVQSIALPQDPFIAVYFNQQIAATYTEPYRHKTRMGDDLEQKIVDAIRAARVSVDVAVQELRLPKVAQALVNRHQAGVKVRVILENTYNRPWSSFSSSEISKLPPRERGRHREFLALVDRNRDGQVSPQEAGQGDALVMLRRARIPVIDDTADGSAGSQLMHHKFVVVDRQRVIVTSANFTTSDVHGDFQSPESRGNTNNLLWIESGAVARTFTKEFELMWGDGPDGKRDSQFGTHKPWRPAQAFELGDTTIVVQFSPVSRKIPWNRSPNGLIGQTLATAQQTVNLALFVFSEQRLVNLLETRHTQGVKIRALMDSGFAYRPYSEGLDMLGVTLLDATKRRGTKQRSCAIESDNRPWQQPLSTVGVPRLARGDLLHHKFGIVDDQTVITGSHNWTDSANLGNDETVLVIHSPQVAAHFQREFERLYAKATIGIPTKLKHKIDAQQQKCSRS